MRPRLHRPVTVVLRPLNRAGTNLDPTFGVPVDGTGNPAAPTYGTSVTLKAQVSFSSWKAPQVKPEGEEQATAGTMTFLAADLPADLELKDARVDQVAGQAVALIIKEARPGGWTAAGGHALVRARLEEADS